MHFRDAVISDLPLIVEIYNSTVAGRLVTADTEPVSVASREAWFNAHTPHKHPLWMVYDDDNNCIGWASYQAFYGRPAYAATAEISIYLSPEQRGKGYGYKILQHCIDKAPSLKINTLLGFIFAHNTPSLQLFAKAGFEEWAHLKNVAQMDGTEYSLKILGKRV
jgi:L-amino acid N-acyltransferase YncA